MTLLFIDVLLIFLLIAADVKARPAQKELNQERKKSSIIDVDQKILESKLFSFSKIIPIKFFKTTAGCKFILTGHLIYRLIYEIPFHTCP